MDKALASLVIRGIDEDERIIRGVASTARTDRQRDIIDPLGIRVAAQVPLLWHHDHRSPIGTVKFDKPTKDGIAFVARMPKILEPGPLKDRVDTAWGEVKHRLVNDVSIGFRPIDDQVEALPNGGVRWKMIEVFELSLVSVGANPDAKILEVRSLKERSAGHVVKLSLWDKRLAKAASELKAPAERRARLGIQRTKQIKLSPGDMVDAFLAERRGKK